MERGRFDIESTRDADWLLQTLVEMADREDSVVGVTLTVGGILVSGQVVGGREFFEGVASDFASVIPDRERAASLRDFLARRARAVYGKPEDGELPRPAVHFIHLRNARFFHPDGDPIPTNRGVWWRGRLEAVDGWCLGVLSGARARPANPITGQAMIGDDVTRTAPS